ncbi:TadE/TadG family type IV pilus assembly protein [Sagittula sp. SSi028]|uniref:TadE/TadG family type IV pilus assembly protein n=1 Tax=Sagittula sp. SSi028 TaxID=3400636 RepID=UPI003AF668E7
MVRSWVTHTRRFWRGTDGAVAVEFALIAPLLITLLFGTMVAGYYIGVSHSVHQLASGAARASVAGLDSTEREALAQAYLDAASSRYPLLVAEALTPAISVTSGSAASMTVDLSYAIEGSVLEIANGFLKLGITDIEGSAYVGY